MTKWQICGNFPVFQRCKRMGHGKKDFNSGGVKEWDKENDLNSGGVKEWDKASW